MVSDEGPSGRERSLEALWQKKVGEKNGGLLTERSEEPIQKMMRRILLLTPHSLTRTVGPPWFEKLNGQKSTKFAERKYTNTKKPENISTPLPWVRNARHGYGSETTEDFNSRQKEKQNSSKSSAVSRFSAD